MNEVEIKKLWDLLSSKYDMGTYTYEEFKKRMSTPEGVKGFYKKYGQELGLNDTQEKTVTTNYVTKYPSTQNPKKAFTWKPCDENTYPWTYGCKNTKIGQMNLSLFGDRYGDIFGDELMNALESYGYFGGSNEKKGEISKTIYDKVTVRDAQQQNESANKKVVKETVKKVLKERLNKK
jgi:hypothetical protein